MNKEYRVKVKYDVGAEVWIVAQQGFDREQPTVFRGEVTSISAVLNDADWSVEPPSVRKIMPTFKLSIAGAFHLKRDFYETELLTEAEAMRVFKVYLDRVKPFSDKFIKAKLTEAKEFIKEYDK